MFHSLVLLINSFRFCLFFHRFRAWPGWTAFGNSANANDSTEAGWQIANVNLPCWRSEYWSRLWPPMERQLQFNCTTENVSIFPKNKQFLFMILCVVYTRRHVCEAVCECAPVRHCMVPGFPVTKAELSCYSNSQIGNYEIHWAYSTGYHQRANKTLLIINQTIKFRTYILPIRGVVHICRYLCRICVNKYEKGLLTSFRKSREDDSNFVINL